MEIQRTPPRLIEVMGPPGVGKSTTLRALFGDPAVNENYIDRFVCEKQLRYLGYTQEKTAFDRGSYRQTFELVFNILAESNLRVSRRVVALDMCRETLLSRYKLENGAADSLGERHIVHDELTFHRALSVLPFSQSKERHAREYFRVAPAPDKLIICLAAPETIAERALTRGGLTNGYQDYPTEDLPFLISELTDCCFIAAEELSQRGVAIGFADLDGELESSVSSIREHLPLASNQNADSKPHTKSWLTSILSSALYSVLDFAPAEAIQNSLSVALLLA